MRNINQNRLRNISKTHKLNVRDTFLWLQRWTLLQGVNILNPGYYWLLLCFLSWNDVHRNGIQLILSTEAQWLLCTTIAGGERKHAGYSAQDLISAIEMIAVSSYSAISCLKCFLIECCVRHITGSCNQKGSYPVMNGAGGHMLQRMGSGKQNKELMRRETLTCKEKRKRVRRRRMGGAWRGKYEWGDWMRMFPLHGGQQSFAGFKT